MLASNFAKDVSTRPSDAARLLPLLLLPVLCMFTACTRSEASVSAAPVPAHAEPVAHASELLALKLDPAAEQRLDLKIVAIEADETQQRRQYAGDVIAPAGGDGTYSRFPSATATDLLAISRAQIEADAQIQRAKAQLDVAKAIHQRAVQLLEEEAGSHLDRDRAQEQLDIAVANLRAAQSQRDLLGPAAVQLGEASSLWLRVPVFSGDLRDLDIAAPARIGEIGAPISEQQTEATPIKAPPSANSALSSVDLYFALPNTSGRFRIGQKLGVALSLRSDQKLTRIPWSAVIQDSHGGEWIYCRTAPQRYLRQRVQVAAVIGDHALLQRGPAIGTAVVVQGGLELFGIEFGVAH